MKPAPFKYVRPDTLSQALAVLAEHGEDVRILAGGQSLGAMLNMRIVTPAIVLDINCVKALESIQTGAAITTGALVRQRDALESVLIKTDVPLLASALPHIGHYQTRNRGTLAGSVAHADPSAEIPLTLATLGGQVELSSKRGVRRVKANEFFRSALVTAREPDELVTALLWPARRATERSSFLEFSLREGDFALVAVACVIDQDAGLIRIGFGGCGETPQLVAREARGVGRKEVIEDLVSDVINSLEYRSDLLVTAAYRRQLATILTRKAIGSALAEDPINA